MRFRLWPSKAPEPQPADEAPPAAPETDPTPAVAPSLPVDSEEIVSAETPAEAAAPEEDAEPQLPSSLTLTIDEAKAAIREAGGDVIQVGFLASAFRRHREDDPESAETAASRKRLCELVAKRLKDRGVLAADGTFDLRERPD